MTEPAAEYTAALDDIARSNPDVAAVLRQFESWKNTYAGTRSELLAVRRRYFEDLNRTLATGTHVLGETSEDDSCWAAVASGDYTTIEGFMRVRRHDVSGDGTLPDTIIPPEKALPKIAREVDIATHEQKVVQDRSRQVGKEALIAGATGLGLGVASNLPSRISDRAMSEMESVAEISSGVVVMAALVVAAVAKRIQGSAGRFAKKVVANTSQGDREPG